jgi:hypothetical protein
MELRRYFRAAGDREPAVSKQAYLRQRQKLNPAVFRLMSLRVASRGVFNQTFE